MSIPSISATFALDFAIRVAAIGFCISAAEQLAIKRVAFGPAGPFSEALARVYDRGTDGHVLLRWAYPLAFWTNLISGLLLVVFGASAPVAVPAILIGLLGQAVVRQRRVLASDGAEQMTTLIFFAALLGLVIPENTTTVMLAVWFIAAQSTLSYTAAGLTKVFSKTWRSGEAMPIIMGSEAHGRAFASRILEKSVWLGRAASWTVVAFECTFWVALIAPPPVTIAYLAVGLTFHVGCAFVMGLNTFVWAFPATYLCVIYAAQQIAS
jgi:hypothetical protein